MKNLKIILSASMICLSAFGFYAQENTTATPEERATKQTEHMEKELGLSAEQKEKIYTIHLGVNQKNEAIRANTEMSSEVKKESIQQNNEARKELFRNILTAEQFTKMEEMEKARSNQKKEIQQRIKKPAVKD